MPAIKEKVMQMIQELPDDVTVDDIFSASRSHLHHVRPLSKAFAAFPVKKRIRDESGPRPEHFGEVPKKNRLYYNKKDLTCVF